MSMIRVFDFERTKRGRRSYGPFSIWRVATKMEEMRHQDKYIRFDLRKDSEPAPRDVLCTLWVKVTEDRAVIGIKPGLTSNQEPMLQKWRSFWNAVVPPGVYGRPVDDDLEIDLPEWEGKSSTRIGNREVWYLLGSTPPELLPFDELEAIVTGLGEDRRTG